MKMNTDKIKLAIEAATGVKFKDIRDVKILDVQETNGLTRYGVQFRDFSKIGTCWEVIRTIVNLG